jgi:hypothetical protein
MANPALKAYIDWNANGNFTGTHDEVSDRVWGEGTLMAISRGANFEGSSGVPGSASLLLANYDNKFTPGNTSSPLTGLIRGGLPIRIAALYNSTTYPLFEGRVRSITPSDTMPMKAEVIAEDAMTQIDRSQPTLALAETRSLWEFREEMLLQAGLTGAQYSLAQSGPEAQRPPTSADDESVLSVMGELNDATRTIDFIRPLIAGWQYVTKDRAAMLAQGAAAAYAADKIESFTGWRATDDERVNYQRVQAEPFVSVEEEELLWELPRSIGVGVGGSRTRWAKWSDPLIIGQGRRRATRIRHELTKTGTVTASITYFATTAKIVLSGGASGGHVQKLEIYGYPAAQQGLGYEESDLSAGDVLGKYDGPDISSRFIAGDADAQGLASYLTFIGAQTLQVRPTVAFTRNQFPDFFVREPGERVSVIDGRLGVTASILIESIDLKMNNGGDWRLSCGARVHPAVFSFTVGGSASQGVGGSGILSY